MLRFMSDHAEADQSQLLADLGRASTAFAQLADAVAPAQLAGPTPCPDVNVRMLVEHLIEGSCYFANLLAGSPASAGAHPAEPLPAAFKAAAAQLLTAFSAPGILTQMFESPIGRASGAELAEVRLIELVTHGWDLARATGQSMTAFPADLCERTLMIARQLYTDRTRGRFGAPQPVSDTAPAADRLAAFLGPSPMTAAQRLIPRLRFLRPAVYKFAATPWRLGRRAVEHVCGSSRPILDRPSPWLHS
jgi:uncharacterized protein (TIGR03086 family)